MFGGSAVTVYALCMLSTHRRHQGGGEGGVVVQTQSSYKFSQPLQLHLRLQSNSIFLHKHLLVLHFPVHLHPGIPD